MREILFRGKRVDNGEWVEGFYVQVDNKAYISLPLDISGDGVITMFDEKQSKAHLYTLSPFLEVVPETVGQYTGLTDKNGNKIFEGDIVKVQGRSTLYCEVTYGKSSAMYWIGNDKLEYYAELGAINLRYLEIVGNVIDNPELVGKYERLEKE